MTTPAQRAATPAILRAVTVGIDLSASPAKTAAASIEWDGASAVVQDLQVGCSDEEVLRRMQGGASMVGIDCPFGWPSKFVDFVASHGRGDLRSLTDLRDTPRNALTHRATDDFIRATFGANPLSVAADKLGHTALRFAALHARLDARLDALLDGTGCIAEVYPAVALKQWGLPSVGYKGRARTAERRTIVERISQAAPWLRLGHHEAALTGSDDALDAVICALVARAVSVGKTAPPTSLELARREGWIHVPTCRLDELANSP